MRTFFGGSATDAVAAILNVLASKLTDDDLQRLEQLIDLAITKNLQIMVDHTFLFTGAVKKIRQLINEGALGNLYYYDSTRVNLGLFQHDCNVIWDLAPHDLSIVDDLIKDKPDYVIASGQRQTACRQQFPRLGGAWRQTAVEAF